MISLTAEYALRAVVWLAGHPEAAMTTRQIADGARIPPGYLSKVLQSLSRAGLLHSRRGPHGGFRLSRPPAELSAWDVIDAVDPIQRINECPLGIKSHDVHLCPLHARLDAAIAMIRDAFHATTIAALLSVPSAEKPGPARKRKGRRGQHKRAAR